jgi:hypothetical protein
MAGGLWVCGIEKIITVLYWPIVSIKTLRPFQVERPLAEIQGRAVSLGKSGPVVFQSEQTFASC